jgi:hypothetical protein
MESRTALKPRLQSQHKSINKKKKGNPLKWTRRTLNSVANESVRRRLPPRRKQRRGLEQTLTVATDVAFEAPRQVRSLSMKRHAKERVKRSRRTRVRHQDPRCPPSWTCFEHSDPPVLLNDCTQQESSTLPHHSIPERTRMYSRQRRHPAGVDGSTPLAPGLSPRDVERASTRVLGIPSPIHL